MSFPYKIFILGLSGHLFVLLHLYCAFGRGKWLFWAVPWFLCMGCALWIHPWLGYDTPAQAAFAWIENIWLPFGVALLSLFLLIDAFCLIRLLLNKLRRRSGKSPLGYARLARYALLLCFAFVAYSLYEAQTIRAVPVTLTTPKPLDGRSHLRIAFVSDMHINALNGPIAIKRVTECIQAQKPDIIILGGDTVDADMKGRDAELAMLRDLKAPLGKFAVLGNHEVSHGIAQSLNFLERAGFTMLRHEFAHAGGLVLAGVDDPHAALAEHTGKHWPVSLLRRLNPSDRSHFIVLVKHRPQVIPGSVGLFDLQLSGHSHGGQIWPAALLLKYVFDAPNGLSRYHSSKGDSTAFVSVGSGFARTPMRFLTPPEVVVIDLVSTAPPPIPPQEGKP